MDEQTPQGIPLPEPQPEQPQPAVAQTTDPTSPPGAGEEALHYAGDEPITVEGVSFAPDSVVIVPADLALRLAGTNNLRIVAETEQSWPNYLALRARARGGRPGG